MKKLLLTLIFLTGCQTDINVMPTMEANSKDETYWYAWKDKHKNDRQYLWQNNH